MEQIFNPLTILFHMFNAALLLLALNFLLYKPVRKFTSARAEGIESQLKNARDSEEKAHQQAMITEQKLKDADEEAITVISKGAQQAQEQAQQILDSAKKETELIIAQARQDVQVMMSNAHQSLADEAASLAVEIAAKMLTREVKPEDHQQLVNDFIQKVG